MRLAKFITISTLFCMAFTTRIEAEPKIEAVQVPASQNVQNVQNVQITRDLPIEKMLECLGDFKLTAYCSCEKCCGKWAKNRPDGIVYGAYGEELREGYSIAVDKNVIPLGTEVLIDGIVYKAQDVGGAIKGNRIDVYFDNHDKAINFGIKECEVYRYE